MLSAFEGYIKKIEEDLCCSHYQRVVVALKETIRLMAEIDKSIPAWLIT